MKKILLFLTLLSSFCNAQTRLSDKAEISVITCGPGQRELYSAFGHSAFRIQDASLGMDDVYNYGVFDFNQPNFYLNFARGYSYYKLAVYDYKHFEYQYIYYDRYIHEQKLNLTRVQKQKLYDFLQWNAQPENQFYRYDYFYDNCATKIPDVLVKAFGDSVTFDGSYVKTKYTIRELTDLYLKHQPWGDLGIDICLGLPMDKKLTPYEYMFLPDFVEKGFAHATIKQGGSTVPLVKERISIYESKEEIPPNGIASPLLVFSVFFILLAVISYRDIRRGKLLQIVDVIIFSVLGVLGILFLLLWVATDHRAAAKNLNLLWALPTHLMAVFAFIKNPKWLMNYFLAIAVLSVLLLVTWPILPQKLHYALIPLVMTVGLRAFTQYYIRKHQRVKVEVNTGNSGN
jgi:hypothetical protein